MKLAEWLNPDDIAILRTAVYYGIPAFGHKNCYKHIEPSQHPLRHVTINEPEISIKHCVQCGEPLIPARLPDGYGKEVES